MRKLYENILSSLWFRPGLWMLAYALLAVGLVSLELRLRERGVALDELSFSLSLLRTEAEGAQAMLGAIATSTLTVTSLAYSLMMVAVVQTANAYSPRLLRRYLRDRRTQHALGILMGTFLFSVLALRSVSSGFTPLLATNVAVLLALLATVTLLLFLNHVSQSIKVSSIISLILARTGEVIARGFPRDLGRAWTGAGEPALPAEPPRTLVAERSGYLQYVEGARLIALTREADLLVRSRWRMGDYVLAGAPLIEVWGALDDERTDALRRTFVLGAERTLPQDADFGLLQLTDIALRAMSPGVNDPSTAAAALDALCHLIGQSIERAPPSSRRCDEDGQLRVLLPRWRFVDLIDDTFLRVLQYGEGDVMVMSRLLHACELLLYRTQDEEHAATLWALVDAIHERARTSITLPGHRRQLDDRISSLCRAHGRAPLASLGAPPQSPSRADASTI
ncbi:MAG: DUF2254 domain-containing protein [Myxococcales bacterium]|nr:DUF2254 domain-containing protein [Myxococcales bacterium]